MLTRLGPNNLEKLAFTLKEIQEKYVNFFHAVTSKTNIGNTKGGSITVPLTSCLTGLESAV
jgi:hypothetical protein